MNSRQPPSRRDLRGDQPRRGVPSWRQTHLSGTTAACTLLIAGATPGCSVAAMTGDVMSGYTVEHLSPYLFGTRDLGMACETGVSMGSYLLSFERVTDPPNRAAISTLLSAAQCAEELAWGEELRGLRALFQGNAPEAEDARVSEKRAHALAASRYHRAYRSMVAAYQEPGETCPELEEESDQLLWLMGLLSGVLAVPHDRASGGVAEVPMDVLMKSARGAACLDGGRWWGVPDALQATVWLSVPSAGRGKSDPWKKLDRAVGLGAQSGVRLASAIFVQTAINVGDEARLRAGIARFAQRPVHRKSNQDYQLFDASAERQILAASDRLWTEATGHRTPVGSLGKFHDSTPPRSEDDHLLDDLGEESP